MAETSTHIDSVGDARAKVLADDSPASLLDRLALEQCADEALRQELAQRTSDGIEVTLFWCACHDTVAVQVSDRGEIFEVVVPRDQALDAFYHPYAYAAQQGLEYELPVLRAV